MSKTDKDRIIRLRAQLRIARAALEKLKDYDSPGTASQALDVIWRLDEKQPLQGLVGHERKPRSG